MFNKIYLIKNDLERPSKMKDAKISFGSINFSKMQVKILERIGEGYTNPQIADDVTLSKRTVEGHVFNIKQVLARYFGYKFCDRELVLFARKMIEDYRTHIKANLEEFSRKILSEQFRADEYICDNYDDQFIDDELAFDLDFYNAQHQLPGHICLDPDLVSPSLDEWTRLDNGL